MTKKKTVRVWSRKWLNSPVTFALTPNDVCLDEDAYVTLTEEDWNAVTNCAGELAPGETYILSKSTAGAIEIGPVCDKRVKN